MSGSRSPIDIVVAALCGGAVTLLIVVLLLIVLRRMRAVQSKPQLDSVIPASPHRSSNTILPTVNASTSALSPPSDIDALSPIGDEDVRVACSPPNTPGRDVSTPLRSQAAWLESMISSSSCAALQTRRPRNLTNELGAACSGTASVATAHSAPAVVSAPISFTHVTTAISAGFLPEATVSSPSRASPSRGAGSSFHELSSSEDEAEPVAALSSSDEDTSDDSMKEVEHEPHDLPMGPFPAELRGYVMALHAYLHASLFECQNFSDLHGDFEAAYVDKLMRRFRHAMEGSNEDRIAVLTQRRACVVRNLDGIMSYDDRLHHSEELVLSTNNAAAHKSSGSSDPRRSVPDAFIAQLARSTVYSPEVEPRLGTQAPSSAISLNESEVDMQAMAEEGRIPVEPQQHREGVDVAMIVDNVLRQVRSSEQ